MLKEIEEQESETMERGVVIQSNKHENVKRLKDINKSERGFTLLELMIVIGLVLVAIATLLSYMSDAGKAQKEQTAIEEISKLSSAIEGERSQRSGYAGITHTYLNTITSVPSSMKDATGLRNIYSKAVKVGGSRNYYTIEYPVNEKSACIKLASKFFEIFNGYKGTPGVPAVTVGTTGTANVTSKSSAVTKCADGPNILKFTN